MGLAVENKRAHPFKKNLGAKALLGCSNGREWRKTKMETENGNEHNEDPSNF